MSSMERGVLAAEQRFPDLGGDIRRLAFADPAFRALCDDLADAQAAVERWAATPSGQAPSRRAEYEQLAAELADEIAAAIFSQSEAGVHHTAGGP